MSATTTVVDSTNLPTTCPEWCDRTHERALAEGCLLETAATHRGPNYEAGRHVNDVHSWVRLELIAEPHGFYWNEPVIRVEVEVSDPEREGRTVSMIGLRSGEARILARRLLHLADLIDLEL